MSGISSHFKILFIVGAIILIVGFIFQWYPSSVIGGLEERLDNSGLSADERSKLSGALHSWRVWQITTFSPISNILIAVGIIVIIYAVISGIFSVVSTYKIVKTAEKK